MTTIRKSSWKEANRVSAPGGIIYRLTSTRHTGISKYERVGGPCAGVWYEADNDRIRLQCPTAKSAENRRKAIVASIKPSEQHA